MEKSQVYSAAICESCNNTVMHANIKQVMRDITEEFNSVFAVKIPRRKRNA